MMNTPAINTKQGRGIWQHFTIKDGLPDMKVECIFEDSRGVLWFGTQSCGVVRYDGGEFTNYTHHDGLTGFSVFSILEDQAGHLWLGTNQGLTHYDGDRFTAVGAEAEYGFLWGSCMDASGTLWFGMDRRADQPAAVCRWNGSKLELIEVSTMRESQGQSIHKIVLDAEGVLWAGGDGLYRSFDGCRFETVMESSTRLQRINDLYPCKEGSLWIINSNEILRIYKDKQLETPDSINRLKGVISLSIDSACNYWIATYSGQIYLYTKDSLELLYTINANIGRLYFDKLGRLWIATYGLGVYLYDFNRILIYDINNGLLDNNTNIVVKDFQDRIWVGTSRGLALLKNDKLEIVKRTEKLNVTRLITDEIRGNWVSTSNGFLYRLNESKKQIQNFFSKTTTQFHPINCLAIDKEKNIWLSSRYGLFLGFVDPLGKVIIFNSKANKNHPNSVGTIISDNFGLIYLVSHSTPNHHIIYRYDREKFTQVKNVFIGSIQCIYFDKNDCLWIGSNEGLICYDQDYNSTIYNKENGLTCSIITCIVQADDGILWIGTEGGGVCVFDGQVFQSIQIQNNVDLNVINEICQDGNRYWFATKGGLVQYNKRREIPEFEVVKIITDQVIIKPTEEQFVTVSSNLEFEFKGKSITDDSSF